MARRQVAVTISDPKSRDNGKTFRVTEMSADRAERWAIRCLLALANAGAKVPDEVFGQPYVPPVSDGSGQDRNLLRKAQQLLNEAGFVIKDGKRMTPGGEVFRTYLPETVFAMRLHHLGYFVPSMEAWNAVLKEIAADGRKIVRDTAIPGFLKAVIVEAPELGHYLEYILPEPGGLNFFEGAPNN